MKNNKKKMFLMTAMLGGFLGLSAVSVGTGGCGSSGSGSGGSSAVPSTDTAANTALINAFVAQGNVSGTWTNNNFGSTGDFTVQSSFDPGTKIFTITVDVDGNVFGVSDPAPEIFNIDLSDFITNGASTINLHSDTYGDISVDLIFENDSTGTFTATATNIPSGASNARVTGSFSISGSVVSFRQDTASFLFGGQNITVSSTIN